MMRATMARRDKVRDALGDVRRAIDDAESSLDESDDGAAVLDGVLDLHRELLLGSVFAPRTVDEFRHRLELILEEAGVPVPSG